MTKQISRGADHFVSLSGGKDSVATALHLKELGVPYSCIFFDTGWEHSQTYEYLRDYLPDIVGPIRWLVPEFPQLGKEAEQEALHIEEMLDHPLGHPCGLVRWTLHYLMAPGPKIRFCTRKLKIDTAKNFYRTVSNPMRVNVLGIRADESLSRSKLKERELSPALDCIVWRPIISWSVQDVIDIHARHNVRPNPLYLKHSKRVGCHPCVLAKKKDVRGLVTDSKRIEVIEAIEAALSRLRKDTPGPSYNSFLRKRVPGDDDAPIRTVLEWSQTSWGGRQLELFDTAEAGCVQWGLCEAG